jgi:uncharacterized protein YbbC (DUF1343 family)
MLPDSISFPNDARVAVLCHQASIHPDFKHILDIVAPAVIFGPQHGLTGHTQDNMIEWEGAFSEKYQANVYSLYGENRKPTAESLRGITHFLIDLQDVGTRVYTFIWTMLLCMERCAELGIPVFIIDRPNPIGGVKVEGTLLGEEWKSFVGGHAIPLRHGLTIGELALLFKRDLLPSLDLQVLPMQQWNREMHFYDTKLPWCMPSPNMPSPGTALVYPGMVLFEGTNVSEGRGTTRPFEIFGASWVNADMLSSELNGMDLPGVFFRPIEFQPTFHKFSGEICGGCFIHVADRMFFEPVLTGIAILQSFLRLYPEHFAYKDPPYEYEHERLPIDLLLGSTPIRKALEQQVSIDEIRDQMQGESDQFRRDTEEILLY